MKYSRLALLWGEKAVQMLHAKHVLLLGVGGVGSLCLDCLYRSGVGHITIVDYDTYDISNQNRQMWSELHLGQSKVASLKTHYPAIETYDVRIDAKWVEDFDFSPYDVVIDAIDDTQAKIALALKCSEKLLSSMGSAKRTDPTEIVYTSIWQTQGDPFARKIRYELRKRNFEGDYKVVTSTQLPQCEAKGSFVAVTGSFGLTLCAKAIDILLEQK
ncbi:MAG: thiamine biosynthesis protein ThiF [Sulfuricurvum sp. PC08-66]|nr:MAG: thiamine biosynthesis protein ThiF [Sulfuricurvum sp. PC08-66]